MIVGPIKLPPPPKEPPEFERDKDGKVILKWTYSYLLDREISAPVLKKEKVVDNEDTN